MTHFDCYEGAPWVTREQVHLKSPKSQVSRKDYPAAANQGARCKILSLTADD